MNIKYTEVIQFIAWLFGEIIRLTQKGTYEELELLSETVKDAKRKYKKRRAKLEKGTAIL